MAKAKQVKRVPPGTKPPLSEFRRRKKFTPLQIRHQQVSWALYVTMGLAANLHKMLTFNTFCIYSDDRKVIEKTLADAERNIVKLKKIVGEEAAEQVEQEFLSDAGKLRLVR